MGSDARETAGLTTRLILAYVRQNVGDDAVAELLERAGEARTVDELEDEATWSTYRQKVALFEAASDLTEDPHVAFHIGASVLAAQVSGPLQVLVKALGSPQRVLRSIARANSRFSTSATMRAIEVSSQGGLVAYRLHDAHQPSRHDCAYNRGLLSQVTVIFDRPPAHILHPSCQVQGAPECVYEVRWSRWRPSWRRTRTASVEDTGLLEARIGDLESTVAEIIAVDDLDTVLANIVERAGLAAHAQRHLLAVELGPRRHLHGQGFEEGQARLLGHELLDAGHVTLEGASVLTSRVASAREQYGWLAAFVPRSGGFLPGEQEHLDAYAGLAAAALEVATSLKAAKRSDRSKAALLLLASQLAHEERESGIAERVAEAAPTVVGAERASVLLWDPQARCMRTVAAVGFDDLADEAYAFQVPRGATPELDALLADPSSRRFVLGSGDPFIDQALTHFGHRSASVAPIVVDGEVLGMVLAMRIHGAQAAEAPDEQLAALASLADQAAIALGRRRLLDQAVHLATHDHLTGLAGRALFEDRVQQALTHHQRSGKVAAIGFLDLDGFKSINDTYGHTAGDRVLVEVARRLTASVRASDTVARMSGDEFALLLRDVRSPEDAERLVGQILTALSPPFEVVPGVLMCPSASIGVALLPRDGGEPSALLRAADGAMYRVKAEGGGGYRTATGAGTAAG